MEHTTFSGSGRLNSFFSPGRVKWSPFKGFQVMLWFLLFTAHAARQVSSHTRNLTYIGSMTGMSVPIWNETSEKTQGKCQKFHDVQFPGLFFYWPEDNPLFRHCCTKVSNPKPIPSFKYSQYGQHLSYAEYRDVGYFDQCLPFWKCRKTYLEILDTQIFVALCEKTDLTKLYWNRFWMLTVWKYSFLDTILPWIPILEVVVILLALAVFPLTWRLASENPAKSSGWKNLVPTGKIWLKSIWKRLLMDWGHMYLLAIVGNGLFEAMRRQNVYSMQSKVFFAYSILYFMLFLILSGASAMQQLAYWIGSVTEPKVLNYRAREKSTQDVEDNVQQRSGADARANGDVIHTKVSFATDKDQPLKSDVIEFTKVQNIYHREDIPSEGTRQDVISDQNKARNLLSCCCFRERTSKTLRLKKIKGSFRKYLSVDVFKLGDDYKWQPIATQAAILFALASFLTFAIDNENDASGLFGILLGYLVQAGCLWTGIYAVVVFFQRAAYIFKFFMKLWENTDNPESCNKKIFVKFQGPYQFHTGTKFPVQIREFTV